MKRWLICLCVAALAALMTAVAACAEEVTGIALPSAMNVDLKAPYSYPMAEHLTLSPEGVEAAVTWSSSRTQYATVNPVTGVIRPRAMGRTKIKATVAGKSAECLVTITAPNAKTIKFNRTALTLNPNTPDPDNPGLTKPTTYQLVAKVTPEYTSEKLEWKSDDESVARVSETGLVTVAADGSETRTCTISVTLRNGRSAKCRITVMKIPERYVRMATSAVVPLYGERPLTALVYPLDAYDRKITWSVYKNPHIASVDEHGVVKGLQKGSAIIQATSSNGRYARCLVTVKLVRYASFSFSLSPANTVIQKGSTFTVVPRRTPYYVSYPDVTVTVENVNPEDPEVAKIEYADGAWTLKALERGYARITATGDAGRAERSALVRVIAPNEEKTVTISAIGDVMLGGDPRRSQNGYTPFDYFWDNNGAGAEYFFKEIKGEFKGIVVANLEIPLIDTTKIVQSSRSYVFRGKTKYAEALQRGGVDVVDLDNNHIMDYGTTGLKSTRTALTKWGIGYFGLGGAAYVIKDGIKIGFVGYRPENISASRMKAHIQAVQKQCDIVVASFHWGVENYYKPLRQQANYGHAAIDAGADLVLGHHSHLVSGIEVYKNRHIVYGLGTIVSAVARPDDIDTFIYRYTFRVTGTTVAAANSADMDIIPVLMTDNPTINDAQPYAVSKSSTAGQRILNKIKQYSPAKNPFS